MLNFSCPYVKNVRSKLERLFLESISILVNVYGYGQEPNLKWST